MTAPIAANRRLMVRRSVLGEKRCRARTWNPRGDEGSARTPSLAKYPMRACRRAMREVTKQSRNGGPFVRDGQGNRTPMGWPRRESAKDVSRETLDWGKR